MVAVCVKFSHQYAVKHQEFGKISANHKDILRQIINLARSHMFARLFTDHPRSVGETYGEHALMALNFSLRMLLASIACLIHAAIPGLFTKTGSAIITGLHHDMVLHRQRKKTPQVEQSAVVNR